MNFLYRLKKNAFVIGNKGKANIDEPDTQGCITTNSRTNWGERSSAVASLCLSLYYKCWSGGFVLGKKRGSKVTYISIEKYYLQTKIIITLMSISF